MVSFDICSALTHYVRLYILRCVHANVSKLETEIWLQLLTFDRQKTYFYEMTEFEKYSNDSCSFRLDDISVDDVSVRLLFYAPKLLIIPVLRERDQNKVAFELPNFHSYATCSEIESKLDMAQIDEQPN